MKNLIALLIICYPVFAFSKIQIATTTADLAAIVRKVGQNEVEVFSIAKGSQDPHQIEAKPSFMVKLRSVDLVFAQGLELEAAWITPLIQGSRNSKLNTKNGLFELAGNLDPIDIPKGQVSRAEGDVHPGGNPHFQLDPVRIGRAAMLIANKLGELDPTHKSQFDKNAANFQDEMAKKAIAWQARIKSTGVSEIVTYHKTFAYFCERFNIKCNIQLEPKPGIPPTASHILSVLEQIKKRKIGLVLIENIYEDSVGQKLRADIPNLKIRTVPVSVEGEKGIDTNEDLIEKIVKSIEEKDR